MVRFLAVLAFIVLALLLVSSVSADFRINVGIIPTLVYGIKPTPSTVPEGKPLPLYPPDNDPCVRIRPIGVPYVPVEDCDNCF